MHTRSLGPILYRRLVSFAATLRVAASSASTANRLVSNQCRTGESEGLFASKTSKVPPDLSSMSTHLDQEEAERLSKQGVSPRWEEIWKRGVNPGDYFDAKGPIPILSTLLQDNALPKGTAFVPGCGRGYDVALFGQHGYDALGMDLVETAVAAANTYVSSVEGITGSAEVKMGNFFEVEQQFDVVYDYTFLCALRPEARESWAKQMHNIVKSDGELVTIIFPIEEKQGGPPYAMSIDLVKSLLEPVGFKATTIEMLPDNMCHPGREGRTALGRWKKHNA